MGQPTTGPLAPTYTAPVGGMQAWAAPDPSAPPVAHIQHRVPFRVLGEQGGWAHIECSNGWQAWVDARNLVGPSTSGVAYTRPRQTLNPVLMRIGRYSVTVLDLIPALAIVLSAFLPWLRGGLGSSNAFKVPVTVLVDTTPSASPIKVGILLVVMSAIAAAAPPRAVRAGAYAVALVTVVLYVVQLNRVLRQADAGLGLGSVLGVGVYVGIVAACLGLGWSLFSRPA